MKTLLKLGGVIIVLLMALAACKVNQISVQWAITGVIAGPGTLYTITYDIWNDGDYDLKNVELTFAITSPSHVITVKSPKFDVSQNVRYRNNQITVSVAPDLGTDVSLEEVVAVDMDKPD